MPGHKTHRGTTGLFAQPIGRGLQQHHKSVFKKSTLELIRLGTYWAQIVGGDLAAATRPLKLHYASGKGSLHIGCYAGTAIELQHMQPILLQRIADILGHRKIQRLKFQQ